MTNSSHLLVLLHLEREHNNQTSEGALESKLKEAFIKSPLWSGQGCTP